MVLIFRLAGGILTSGLADVCLSLLGSDLYPSDVSIEVGSIVLGMLKAVDVSPQIIHVGDQVFNI